MKSVASMALCTLILVLISSGDVWGDDDPAEPLDALNDFISAWNDADNDKLRKTLNYPHLSLFGPGRLIIASEPDNVSTDFQRMRDRENWHHSTFDSHHPVYVTEHQTHFITTYGRYTETDARPYHTGHVYYIVTNQNGHWGMQLRGGMGSGPKDSNTEAAARKAIDTFFTAWNKADNEAIHRAVNFPHAFLIRDGRTAIARGPDELMTDFDAMREREGWHDSQYHGLEILHAGPAIAYAKLTFTRHHDDGAVYRTVPVLWIITNQDGHWGIQLRAILPPEEN